MQDHHPALRRRYTPALAVATAVAVTALLGACAVGPDYVKPEPQLPQAWDTHDQPGNASHPVALPAGQAADPQWWKQFNDPELDALEQRAVTGNLDIQVAASRLQQSRAARRIVGAEALPSVGANANYQRTGASSSGLMSLLGVSNPPASQMANGTGYGNSGVQGNDVSEPFNLYQYGFDASWELDLWGRTRRQIEAADALAQASDETRHETILAVVAETAADYVQLRASQASLNTATQMLDLAHRSLELTQRRRADGAATDLDVINAQALVSSLEAALPPLLQQNAHLIDALSLLLAQPPGTLAQELATAQPVPPVPAAIPVEVPSGLARRRPDIRRADALLHAATASIGVAKADFYPSVTLSGSFGMQSMSFASVGTWAARQFAVGPTLSLPIFEGGRLRAQLNLREAQQQEAALAYQRTVLGAWNEIDDTLSALSTEQQRRTSLAANVAQSDHAWQLATSRYQTGAGTQLDILATQRTTLAAKLDWIRSDTNVSLNAIRLYKALGGGWESAGETPLAAR
ncbi:secretion protein [Caballeronia mineralivorans PML1(12)]|uniref:Secretion protein n=1 Tax=Caballeronia mineralivorans PML1(12) TaxID=908627 RepID=A0A0J1FPW2_9BURK|nr:efflux transporter outer membrane subunit [Caballeronia mineralivorans]KLU21808.1 secretion protein [Caballeronia mineralivorans PML1(12)]